MKRGEEGMFEGGDSPGETVEMGRRGVSVCMRVCVCTHMGICPRGVQGAYGGMA